MTKIFNGPHTPIGPLKLSSRHHHFVADFCFSLVAASRQVSCTSPSCATTIMDDPPTEGGIETTPTTWEPREAEAETERAKTGRTTITDRVMVKT